MDSNLQARISQSTEQLEKLLAAPSTNYAEWRPEDFPKLKELAGVYHFFDKSSGQVESLYVGKGGFGKGDSWSLHSRLKQHFQPSQQYALLGKASKALGISPDEAKAQFNASGLQVQWLALGSRESMDDTNLASKLLSLECFAIAILRPRYTDA